MLRFVLKNDSNLKRSINKFTDELPLSSYHLKTLMMWTCETWPLAWCLSEDVVGICSYLFSTLARWLERRHCPHYFIPESNLFGRKMDYTVVQYAVEGLLQFKERNVLSHWFINNYVLRAINDAKIPIPNQLAGENLQQVLTSKVQQFFDWKIIHDRENMGYDIMSCIRFLTSCFSNFTSNSEEAKECNSFINIG